ncbi:MAG: zinc-ribbon domain-containing protein [Candidatus Helarchaeota archaeon]
MSSAPKVSFISDEIKIAGTDFTFQVAELKGNWAIRIINRKDNKVLTVEKLANTTDAAITDVIKNVLGRKYGKELVQKIDYFDLGGKMPALLQKIQEFKNTGKVPEPTMPVTTAAPTASPAKPTRKPDDFWSAYASASPSIQRAPSLQEESISFVPEQPVENDTPTPQIDYPEMQYSAPPPTIDTASALDSTLSILGVKCPKCGAEIDNDEDRCPYCGQEID